ncbi:hypothetical protein [Streptomyces thermoviolaceus]|nr:hypothetical protein [Streptomyces thermoviolaceus]GGV65399.1 hypothetical protein GCM10010499_09640 [Streptomyces thermoviolaceus subsp. apingens]
MARMRITADRLVVRLSWWEKAAARRWRVSVPLSAVRRVVVEPDWWRALRGCRAGGVEIPGVACAGERRHQAGRDFVAVRPGRPVVCAELWQGSAFLLLAVSARDVRRAEGVAAALRRAAPRLDTSTPCRQPLPVPEESEQPVEPQGSEGPPSPDAP